MLVKNFITIIMCYIPAFGEIKFRIYGAWLLVLSIIIIIIIIIVINTNACEA